MEQRILLQDHTRLAKYELNSNQARLSKRDLKIAPYVAKFQLKHAPTRNLIKTNEAIYAYYQGMVFQRV